jgi:hypothetical protein
MAVGEVKSIAEHWDVLMYLVVGLMSIVGVLLSFGAVETLRRLSRMEGKQDLQQSVHEECRRNLMSKIDFLRWVEVDFSEWKKGRDGLWNAINHHSHEGVQGDGKVLKT